MNRLINLKNISLNSWLTYTVATVLAVIPLVFVPINHAERFKVGDYTVVMPQMNDFFYQPKQIALLAVVVALLIILLLSRRLNQLDLRFDKTQILAVAFISWMALSAVFADNQLYAWLGRPFRHDGFITYLAYFIIFLMARHIKLTHGLIQLATLSMCLVGGYAILQIYGLEPFARDLARVEWGTAFSTMGNPNYLGAYLVLLLPLSVHGWVSIKQKRYLASFTLGYYALLCSNTRGSWIGFVVAFIVYLIFIYQQVDRRQLFKRVALLLALIVILTALFNITLEGKFANRFSTFYTEAGKMLADEDERNTAGSFRMYIWQKTLLLIKKRPILGYGPENLLEPFVDNFLEDSKRIAENGLPADKAHNEYLHYAVTSGVPLTLIYIALLLTIERIARRRRDDYIILYAAVFGYCVQALFNSSIVSFAYIFWVYLGLLAMRKCPKTTAIKQWQIDIDNSYQHMV